MAGQYAAEPLAYGCYNRDCKALPVTSHVNSITAYVQTPHLQSNHSTIHYDHGVYSNIGQAFQGTPKNLLPGQMSFLSPNQQRENTEGVTKCNDKTFSLLTGIIINTVSCSQPIRVHKNSVKSRIPHNHSSHLSSSMKVIWSIYSAMIKLLLQRH